MPDISEQLRNWSKSLAESIPPTDLETVTLPTTTGESEATRRWLAVAASVIVVAGAIFAVAMLRNNDTDRISPATNPAPFDTDNLPTSTIGSPPSSDPVIAPAAQSTMPPNTTAPTTAVNPDDRLDVAPVTSVDAAGQTSSQLPVCDTPPLAPEWLLDGQAPGSPVIWPPNALGAVWAQWGVDEASLVSALWDGVDTVTNHFEGNSPEYVSLADDYSTAMMPVGDQFVGNTTILVRDEANGCANVYVVGNGASFSEIGAYAADLQELYQRAHS